MHCVPDHFSIGLFVVEKNVINDSPDYQRESGIWPVEKQQLFLDSLLNKYDIPKLYLHDLRGKHGKFKFAVIDGKQRLHTIWRFIDGDLALDKDFELFEPDKEKPPLKAGSKYSELDPVWQEVFKSKNLDVVLVQNADINDIEDLFSRLNNGEPLNAAEKRNAMGGDMTGLIRDVGKESFFDERLNFPNNRYQHYEISAKLLLIEKTEADSGDPFCDLKKRYLDALVDNNRQLKTAVRDGLLARVASQLKTLAKVFEKKDPLLSKQAAVPMYYLFVKVMDREYASKTLYSDLKSFLQKFQALRILNLQKKEEERDPVLVDFGRLTQQGTNDITSLRQRVSILRRYFLLDYPAVAIRDKKRAFSYEERYAIYVLSGKQCAECKTPLRELGQMEADHKVQWAHGGPTVLANARALCEQCNKSLAQKVK